MPILGFLTDPLLIKIHPLPITFPLHVVRSPISSFAMQSLVCEQLIYYMFWFMLAYYTHGM